MKNVALRAGVSAKTVSNVVRGWPHVSDETRERVESAIDELGYRMNLSARTLKSGRSGIIALAVPWLDSPYFAELTSSVVRAAEDRGWTVIVEETGSLLEREVRVVDGLRGQLVDGVIFSPSAVGPAQIAGRERGIPMVLLGERVGPGLDDHVVIDNVSAAFDMVNHLLGTGRSRLASIGHQASEAAENSRQRAQGLDMAVRHAGVVVPAERHQAVAAFSRAEGAAAMERLLDLPNPPDAVFCFSDLLALGAMHAVHRRGLSVPDDIVIAGFDDIEDGRFSNPPLTTVRPDKASIASRSVDFVIDRIEGANVGPAREFTPGYELVLRPSTAAVVRAPGKVGG